MPAIPSIKATGFQSAADDLAKLVAAGRVSPEELEARLMPEDLSYLGKQLAASSWVPMATYMRALDVLIGLEAGRDVHRYLRERGRRAAERLHKTGLYGQFEASIETWGHQVGTITATMGAVLYNFTRWSFESDADTASFRTIVDDAREYPEHLLAVGEGFIEYLAQHLRTGRKVQVTAARVSPDRVVFSGSYG
ncbi:MAG TPA: hypothetical protein VKF60_08670 [Myxococcota bacterium]|nr:hypothetical protein [Myxococcota bacterium]